MPLTAVGSNDQMGTSNGWRFKSTPSMLINGLKWWRDGDVGSRVLLGQQTLVLQIGEARKGAVMSRWRKEWRKVSG